MTFNFIRKRALEASSALNVLALAGGGIAAALALPTAASAQDITSGRLTGDVIDADGNPVAGATVVLSSEQQGVSRTLTSGSNGTFNAAQLPVGNYQLTVSAPGYQTVTATDVAIQLGGNSYSFTLTPGVDTENAIIVTGRSIRTVDFSQAATGAVFNVQETAERLPVPRSLEGVALLAPQTVSGDSAFGNNVALAGSSVAENIYYINGMNITNFRTFVGGSTVPFEFYEQLQVKTGGYQAEFGRATGGALIAITRSGSNELRGGVNAYWAPSGLRSAQPNSYVQDNSRDKVDDVEGNIWASGPIIKDKLFFFGMFNPRYYTSFGATRSDVGDGGFTETTLREDEPFYGGKIDFQPFDGQRLEFTYFRDFNRQTQSSRTLADGSDPATPFGTILSEGESETLEGGTNMIAKYSGTFTDWLTVSALYGKSKFERTTQSSLDANPAVYDGRGGGLVQIGGSPAFTVENGRDEREQYRADIDLFFDLLGSHQVRFGVDHEILTAENTLQYSGGAYWRYYTAGPSGAFGGAIAPGQDYARLRIYNSGGTFESQNTAFYIQDNWDITDRLQLSLGVRNDRFKNLNASGNPFTDIKNQWAPRLGATYDVFGDRRTKLSAFFGRYFLPVAANTNIRLAGDELFTEQFFSFTGMDQFNAPTGTVAVTPLNVLSDSQNPNPDTLISTNLEPQHLDEYLLGVEHDFGNGWTVGLNGVYRNLASVLEDADLGVYAIPEFCAANPATCGGESTLSVGSGGYILLNPGKDANFYVEPQGGFQGGFITVPASFIDLPEAKREYYAVELSFERRFDGVWGLQGSYTWSEAKGNYEGGVKSDNGQDDTGLTQDFDEPGWMDGSYGYLPNHRRHAFKLFGTYQPLDWLRLSANARVLSPRKYGCVGIYPFQDGRAQDPYAVGSNDTWYCGDRSGTIVTDADGEQFATSSVLVGRGNAFDGKWEKRLDLGLAITPQLSSLRGMTFRVDVFNVFNFDDPIDFNENGDEDNVITQTASGGVLVPLNEDYAKPTTFQTPRYVRFGVSFDF